MARAATKQMQVFTVRLADGSRLGGFSAYTPKQAIDTAIREYAAQAATFRSSMRHSFSADGATATVEPPAVWRCE